MGLFSKKKTNIQDAKTQYNKGNYRKALKICKDYLEDKENDFEALNLLGDIYYKLGDKDKSLDNYRKLISILESEKYIDKAIAVIRKVIRQYPDQYDLYRKLSKLFEKKGFTAEQLKILYELSEIYQKDNLTDKAIDILKEIVEIDRGNLENYKKIFTALDSLGKKHEIGKLIYPALEVAYNKQRFDYLNYFMNVILKNDLDFLESVKFTFKYFEKNKDKADIFNKYAKQYLLEKEFDRNLFQNFLKMNDVSKELGFILNIKDKYQDISIYDVLIDYYILKNNKDMLVKLFNEIQSLPDFLFVKGYFGLIEKHIDEINDIEILDIMVVIAGKLAAYELQIKIYNKLVEIYKNKNDFEKAERILNYIEGIKSREYDDTYIEDNSFDEFKQDDISNAQKEKQTEDIEDDFSELIVDTSLSDTDEAVVDEIDVDIDIDEFTSDLDIETNSITDNDFNNEDDLEIDLLQEVVEEDIIVETDSNEEFDLVENDTPDFDIFENGQDEFELDLDLDEEENVVTDDLPNKDDNSVDGIDNVDFQISEIKNLIDSNKFEEASEKIDELLLRYPDNDEVKSLSLQIFLADKDYDEDDKVNIQEQMADIFHDFKLVANSMRKSVNAQVRPDDYETHYDLAMAYMEMELFDEALEELKKSAVGNKRYESLYLMAECYKRMKLYEDAINVHKLIIIDYNDQEILKNSLYEIALILDSIGDKSSAMNYYSKIYSLDENFRDVKLRLDSMTIVNSKPKTAHVNKEKKKKKKISFL